MRMRAFPTLCSGSTPGQEREPGGGGGEGAEQSVGAAAGEASATGLFKFPFPLQRDRLGRETRNEWNAILSQKTITIFI